MRVVKHTYEEKIYEEKADYKKTDLLEALNVSGFAYNANLAKGTFPYELPSNRAMADNIKELNLYLEEDANAFMDASSRTIRIIRIS